MNRRVFTTRAAVLAALFGAGCAARDGGAPPPSTVAGPAVAQGVVGPPTAAKGGGASGRPLEPPDKEARHLAHITQLTTEGKNGEAYFAADGRQIVFQSIRGASPYYQIHLMDDEGGHQRMLSTGRGKTTCAFFRPDGRKLVYASTHGDPRAWKPGVDPKPPEPPRDRRYQWDFDAAMDIWEVEPDGKNLRQLTTAPGYDAEGSYDRLGLDIVFTSLRDGDAEIYVMDAVGNSPRRLTHRPGYDGGPFFSPDGSQIVWRSFRYRTDDRAEIFVMNRDGTGERQLTDLKVISWAPYFHPDGKRLVFAANLEGHNFELYLVAIDGSGLERVTFGPRFDSLPSFSRDGRRLLWTSNRGPGGDPERGVSQIFVADWID